MAAGSRVTQQAALPHTSLHLHLRCLAEGVAWNRALRLSRLASSPGSTGTTGHWRPPRRGRGPAHWCHAIHDLERSFSDCIAAYNENPGCPVWTKSAGEVPERMDPARQTCTTVSPSPRRPAGRCASSFPAARRVLPSPSPSGSGSAPSARAGRGRVRPGCRSPSAGPRGGSRGTPSIPRGDSTPCR